MFVYTEFLALAIAKVWAGKADLPGTTELWRRYDETVKYRGGFGKNFQFFTPEEYEGGLILYCIVSLLIFLCSCNAIFPRLAQR